MQSRSTRNVLPLMFFLCGLPVVAPAVHAQIPFYTDDADTTAKGKFHLEIYNEHDVLQKTSYPTKRQNTLVFTLDYGLTNKLEACRRFL